MMISLQIGEDDFPYIYTYTVQSILYIDEKYNARLVGYIYIIWTLTGVIQNRDIKSKLYENVYGIFSKCSQLSLYYTLGDDFDRLNKY